jgi:hypothetical protein
MAGRSMADQRIGGEGGIRTPGTVPRTLDFESSAFNRARPPLRLGGHTIEIIFAFKRLIPFCTLGKNLNKNQVVFTHLDTSFWFSACFFKCSCTRCKIRSGRRR